MHLTVNTWAWILLSGYAVPSPSTAPRKRGRLIAFKRKESKIWMVARRPLGRNSWDQQAGTRRLAGIYTGQKAGESRFKGKIAKCCFNSGFFPRGAPCCYSPSLEFFDHSLYTNPDPWVTPELCPHSRLGWGAGSPVGPLAVSTVSPGIGPAVPAKSHQSPVLTCCCEGIVRSYFSCSVLAPSWARG